VEEEEVDMLKVHAMIHGIDPDKETTPGEKEKDMPITKPGAEPMPMMFKDPKEYAHLSQEEKEKLTQEMMSKHRGFLTHKGILLPKKPRL